MSNQPIITVGIPVFNSGRWLMETVESIFAQTVQDVELVICDNASTDNTEDICRSLVAKDSRVKYYRSPVNQGAPKNYNQCVNLAHGKYFKWSSSSDLCLPTFLERCIDVLESMPDVSLCYTGTKLLNDDGTYELVEEDSKLDLELISEHPSERFIRMCESLGLNHLMNGVMRTEQLRSTALNQQFYSSDLCLMAEIVLLGRAVYIPEYLFIRRNNYETASSLADAKDRQRYLDPELKSKMLFQRLKLLHGYYRAARRVPIEKSEKRKVYLYLLKRIRWARYRILDDVYIAFRSLIG